MGYDIGNVMANLMFAWVNADATMSTGAEKDTYMDWLQSTMVEVIDLFRRSFKCLEYSCDRNHGEGGRLKYIYNH